MKYFLLLFCVLLSYQLCFAQTTDDAKYEQAEKCCDSKDYDKAIPILMELAEKNHAKALCQLGFLFECGYGVKQDIKRSLEYTQKSAELGWMVAQHNLGYYYETEFGVEKDYGKAYEWYKKAAEQGFSKSLTNNGWFYENGFFVGKNIDKAVKYYQDAAEKGETQAMIVALLISIFLLKRIIFMSLQQIMANWGSLNFQITEEFLQRQRSSMSQVGQVMMQKPNSSMLKQGQAIGKFISILQEMKQI